MPRWVGALLFFGIAILIWGGLHVWIYSRVATALALDPRGRLAFKLILAFLGLAYLLARVVGALLGHRASLPLLWPGALWLGFASLAASALLVFEVGVAFPSWGLQRAGAIRPETAAAAVRLGVAAALVLAAGLLGWGMTRALMAPAATEVEVRLPGLPASLDRLRVVVASDVHAGELVSPAIVDRIAATVERADPDLVLLAGDLTDEPGGGDGRAFARLAAIKAMHGVIASTGNHEFYSGGETVVRSLESHGIRVLRQAHLVVANGLVVAAVDDPAFLDGGRGGVPAAIDRALAGRPHGLPVILMSHQPLAVQHAAAAGVDLMVCGHTHGGQLPPFQAITGLAFDFLAGLHRVGDMWVHVNRGAGFWGPPVRVFADPEVVVLVLRAT